MGVAFGAFLPALGYEAIATQCRSNHADQSNLALSVQTEEGVVIPCLGVSILDYSAEANEPFIEVNVVGIDRHVYEDLFSEHVAAYERQFKTP